jgi:choline kinase
MKCLIVAAGFGSRLRSLSECKPLTPVAGVPMIEHVVRAAAAGGASDFTVVTGHEAERLEAFLAALAERSGLPIACVRTEDWTRPNGLSVVSGAAAIDGDHLLMMADHLFDPAIVARLIEAGADDGVTLAIDRDVSNPLIDLDDATKVSTDGNGVIIEIGKTLENYDAFDTGLFLATPALPTAIREAVSVGKSGSISDGMQLLADRGQAHCLDVTGCWWLDVDDPPSHALAEQRLARDPLATGQG